MSDQQEEEAARKRKENEIQTERKKEQYRAELVPLKAELELAKHQQEELLQQWLDNTNWCGQLISSKSTKVLCSAHIASAIGSQLLLQLMRNQIDVLKAYFHPEYECTVTQPYLMTDHSIEQSVKKYKPFMRCHLVNKVLRAAAVAVLQGHEIYFSGTSAAMTPAEPCWHHLTNIRLQAKCETSQWDQRERKCICGFKSTKLETVNLHVATPGGLQWNRELKKNMPPTHPWTCRNCGHLNARAPSYRYCDECETGKHPDAQAEAQSALDSGAELYVGWDTQHKLVEDKKPLMVSVRTLEMHGLPVVESDDYYLPDLNLMPSDSADAANKTSDLNLVQ